MNEEAHKEFKRIKDRIRKRKQMQDPVLKEKERKRSRNRYRKTKEYFINQLSRAIKGTVHDNQDYGK